MQPTASLFRHWRPAGLAASAVLKLMYAALIRAAERWRGLRMTEFAARGKTVIRPASRRPQETWRTETHCLADDAVNCEPVSAPKSL